VVDKDADAVLDEIEAAIYEVGARPAACLPPWVGGVSAALLRVQYSPEQPS